eukprot:1940803-Amphidinium_carterae.1
MTPPKPLFFDQLGLTYILRRGGCWVASAVQGQDNKWSERQGIAEACQCALVVHRALRRVLAYAHDGAEVVGRVVYMQNLAGKGTYHVDEETERENRSKMRDQPVSLDEQALPREWNLDD